MQANVEHQLQTAEGNCDKMAIKILHAPIWDSDTLEILEKAKKIAYENWLKDCRKKDKALFYAIFPQLKGLENKPCKQT